MGTLKNKCKGLASEHTASEYAADRRADCVEHDAGLFGGSAER